jgi:hypothetical protein
VWCDTVEIDDELFEAQDEHRLVVFAGAGISMGAPSNLPSFQQLVLQIGDGTIHPDDQGLPFDAILGRMEFRGIDVHERCRAIIANSTNPNAIHSAILRLFRNPEDVRVVMTNFDKHFSTSAGPTVPVYYAPALPLGGDFNGIVHLHGSIDVPARMVLTDGNFGAAYMTDGYAARFLRDLFATYTVLFIGYSHTDPPMNYFNLGLGARRRRHFILTHEDLPYQWRRLQLTPLLYQLGQNGSDHSKLDGAVEEWAEQTALRPSDVAGRLQQILANPQVISPSDEGFLRRHYNREHSVGAFVEHAQLFDWVPWMHGKGLIRPLLTEQNANNTNGTLSFWLGRTLAKDGSGVGLSIVEECGGVLNFSAARGILIEVLNAWEHTKPTLAQKQWLSLLLRQSPATYLALHARLISLLGKYDEWVAALRVVTFLVSSSIRNPSGNGRDEYLGHSGPTPTLTGEHFDLTQSLEAIERQAGKDTQRQMDLLRVLEHACLELGEQYELLGRNNHHQGDIVPHTSILAPNELHTQPIDALIRFTCLFAVNMAAKLDKATFIRWMDSKNQILIRCALLCMPKSQLGASEVLDVLLNHNGIYPLAFRADIERALLMHAIYPKLTESEKQAYWQAIKQGPSDEWAKGLPNE